MHNQKIIPYLALVKWMTIKNLQIMETKFWVTVEDHTKSFTSSLIQGTIGTRYNEIGIMATSLRNAQQLAIYMVSKITGTSTDYLTIA